MLLEFPAELLAKIFLNLDFQSALSLQRVNRLLHHLYQNSAQLQYHVECEIAGVYDNPCCSPPIQTRLQILRTRELTWASLRPVLSEELSFPASEIGIFGVTGGYYYTVLRESSTDTLSRIPWYTIPTRHRGDGRSTYHSELSVEGLLEIAACIDENDLVVCLVERGLPEGPFDLQILLFQHSSGAPHPSAVKPAFSIFRPFDKRVETSLQMQVVGENLVLAVNSPFKELYFYNWKTGESKGVLPNYGSSSFVFLRHDLLCNPNIKDKSLEIYYIPSSGEIGSVRCIQILSLPFVQGTFDWVNVRGSPNPTFGELFPKYVSTDQPFLERPEEATIIFQISLVGISCRSMVIHRKTLLKLLPPREHWLDKTHTTDWDEWRSNVAVFDTIRDFRLVTCGQNGQRCIILRRFENPRTTFGVVDFNPYRIRKAQKTRAPVLQEAGVLPYLAAGLPDKFKVMYHTFYASDTGLLGLKFVEGETGFRVARFDAWYFD